MAPTVERYPIADQTNKAADWHDTNYRLSEDYIASGFAPTDSGGLVVSIANGVAYCNGVRHSLTGGGFSLTMTDDATNYIFYDPTTLDFHVDTNDSRPTNGVRIAVVVTVAADITTLTDVRELQFGIPSGLIAIWSGTIANIPSGWVLCNGSNGTPDLRDRMVTGVGTTYVVGDTGGEATHTLTIPELPAHTHTYNKYTYTGSGWDNGNNFEDVLSTTGSTGGGQSHNNMPPYYALAFIMKL